ncbi:hypothetical protein [Chryseobacterium jejuense]|nr:hypothetical protein [Chryseobacterium jejuense]MBP2615808.1 hypothetical protein [Chryseobacterium jejuense]
MFKKINFNNHPLHLKYKWEQNCWLKLQITNTGQSVIEDYKIELEFEGDFEKVGAESGHFLYNPNYINNVKEYRNSNKALIIVPKDQTLVQGDSFTSGNFYIEPKVGEGSEVRLNWKLLSRDFTDTGSLIIKIMPKFHKVFLDNEIDNIEDVREEISYKLIERPGMSQIGYVDYFDKESDYNFE